MKKRIFAAFLAVSILVLAVVTPACADVIPSQGAGQIGFQAVVLCDKLTVRQEPNAGSAAVRTLDYGTVFSTFDEENGFSDVFIGDDVDGERVGWVKTDYIFIDPSWYVTEDKTPVYAWADTSAPKVALLDPGEKLAILNSDADWFTVSLRGASGWILR